MQTEPLSINPSPEAHSLVGQWRLSTRIAFVVSATCFLVFGSVAGFAIARSFTPLMQVSDYERKLVDGHRRAMADFEANLAKTEDPNRDAQRIADILKNRSIPPLREVYDPEEPKIRVSAKPSTPDTLEPANPTP